ncbi:hypothetical protein Taro_030808, partial [Colocasia esculenta]|nr:hypothetical protein [Colocasia esculenta]
LLHRSRHSVPHDPCISDSFAPGRSPFHHTAYPGFCRKRTVVGEITAERRMQFFGGSAEVNPSPPAPAGAGTVLSGNITYMLYLFNRHGVCLLYREWHRPVRTLDAQQDQKLMFGLLFSLRSFTAKIDPTSVEKGNLGIPLSPHRLPGVLPQVGEITAERRMQFFGGSAEVNPSPPAPAGAGTVLSYMLYLFNRHGVCLLYREWHRPVRTLDAQQDQKLMFGLLFSLRSFTAKIDPTSVEKGNLGVPLLPGQGCSFHSFSTNTYKLSFMESASGVKIILVTHPKCGDLREYMAYIYNLYVEYVPKNPIYVPGTAIKSHVLVGRRPQTVCHDLNVLLPASFI